MVNDNRTPSGLKPAVQSFILADHVYVDSQSGKKVIAGTFNRVALGVSQTALVPVYAYLALTNCRGHVEFHVRLIDLGDGNILHESARLRFDAQDPLHIYELVMELSPLPLPHEGSYALEACCNGQTIGSVTIGVARRKRPGEQP